MSLTPNKAFFGGKNTLHKILTAYYSFYLADTRVDESSEGWTALDYRVNRRNITKIELQLTRVESLQT